MQAQPRDGAEVHRYAVILYHGGETTAGPALLIIEGHPPPRLVKHSTSLHSNTCRL